LSSASDELRELYYTRRQEVADRLRRTAEQIETQSITTSHSMVYKQQDFLRDSRLVIGAVQSCFANLPLPLLCRAAEEVEAMILKETP
jgi:hypothetical protein